MARTVFLDEADQYVLVREIEDLSMEDKGHVKMAMREITKGVDADGESIDDDRIDVTVTHLYMLADVFSFLPSEAVKDLGPKSITEIVNAAVENADADDLYDVPTGLTD